ncbi:MAG: peptidoglycan-binding protein [Cyanobacteria bacterium P01_H01_bin.121]
MEGLVLTDAIAQAEAATELLPLQFTTAITSALPDPHTCSRGFTLAALAVTATTASWLASPSATQAAVRPGDVCPIVGDIQQALANRGYNPGPVDNVFGGSTEAAVVAFQAREGLLLDGVVGRETGAALGLDPARPALQPGISCRSVPSIPQQPGSGGSGSNADLTEPGNYQIRNVSVLRVLTEPYTDANLLTAYARGQTIKLTGRVINSYAELAIGGWALRRDLVKGDPPSSSAEPVRPIIATAVGNVRCSTGIDPSGVVEAGASYEIRSGQDTLICSEPYQGARVNARPETGTELKAAGAVRSGYIKTAQGRWVPGQDLSVPSGGQASSTPINPAFAPGGRGTRQVVAASGLNIRAEPSLSGAIVGGLADGAIVQVTRVAENGYVELARGGWVAAEYLRSLSGGIG